MQNSRPNTTNKYGLSENIISLLQNTFSRSPKIELVKIFGSRAMGNYQPGSDIDLAFCAKNFSHDDFLNLSLSIDDLVLLYEIDLIDYHKINNPNLKEHIDTIGKGFYRKLDKSPA